MTSESLTAEITQARQLANAAEANSANLTLKLQAAVEWAVDRCTTTDAAGKVEGFELTEERVTDLIRVCSAYRDFQSAEAARRSSLRPPPPPQINLPHSLKPPGPPHG